MFCKSLCRDIVKDMSHHLAADAAYVADGDNLQEEIDGSCAGRDENDFENNIIEDITAAQAKMGRDIQGIAWERLSVSRNDYRQTRLEQYRNYESVPRSVEVSNKESKMAEKGGSYYQFKLNSRSVKPTILHFQLRNLVWATSQHDVYLTSDSSIIHWNALAGTQSEVLNVAGHVAPVETHPGSLLEGFRQTQVSTLAVKDGLLAVGGFQGELICKHLDRPGVSFCSRLTDDVNAIVNAVEIYNCPSGLLRLTAALNDCGLREFDVETFQETNHFRFPWPVNYTSQSPDGKLLVVVGDDADGLVVDAQSGKTISPLRGHLDYAFASAWHPDGVTFATGSQDKTCRVWDARNLSESVHVLEGNIGAVRSIRYTSDGLYMSMAEPADFVHVFDVKTGYNKEQEIDFFGEIAGFSFSPDAESLFTGVSDRTYGSLLEYNRSSSARALSI